MTNLWDKSSEIDFFSKSLNIVAPEKLFYTSRDGKRYAYWPKSGKDSEYGDLDALNSRNAYIGDYTEKWAKDVIQPIAKKLKCYAVQGVVCTELELTKKSPADIAICKIDSQEQEPEDIIAILEVKMSLVWNWEFLGIKTKQQVREVGDFTTHKGNPGMLRSDTMLKAIGKSISVRLASMKYTRIPLIIIGNTPIQESYYNKVDNLKSYGIVQGFWSLNPKPLDEGDTLKHTKHSGFIRFDLFSEFENSLLDLLKEERTFFAGMRTKKEIGSIIEIANKENTYEAKAERFLALLSSGK